MGPLLRRSHNLIGQALRPRTRQAYSSKFRFFMALASFYGVHDVHTEDYMLCFLTYLFDMGVSPASIAGYLAAVKHAFITRGFDTDVFESRLVCLLQKSFSINAPLKIKTRGIIDINMLQNIINACDYLHHPLLYKAMFLLAFFTFLRISNLAPLAARDFDTTRHLTRGDVIWGPPGAHLIVKWAKNMQGRRECHVIQIPKLTKKLLCPVQTLYSYFNNFPNHAKSPMFINPSTQTPIIQSNIRQALARVSTFLNLPPGFITFHCFRRSGATFAFNHNVQIQNIQHHGGWKSDSVRLYLTKSNQGTASVAETFKKHIL